jgi:NDP-sugar pyrophosphorylase family protein
LHIEYSFEDKPLGTAGPIALVKDKLHDDFLVMNGDLLTTLNYRHLFEYHRKMNASATIGLYKRQVKIDFGVIEQSSEGKLMRYIEKPTHDYSVSMGVNVMHKASILPYLHNGVYLDIPDLMISLMNVGNGVYCYNEPCYWLDIGRVEDYKLATEIFESKQNEFLP